MKKGKKMNMMLGAFIVLAIGMSGKLNAQGMTATDQDVTFTVRLNEAIGLEVLKTASVLEFSAPADYQNGVNKTETGALRVTSTRAYELKVKSRDANFTHSSGSTIAIGSLNVETPTVLTSNSMVVLSTADQTIATGSAAIKKEIDLKYSTNVANTDFIGKAQGDYTAALVYSVVTL